MTAKNNPIDAKPRTFFQDNQGEYFDENPYWQGLRKPKRWELADIARLAKFEPVQVVRAVEPTLTGQEQVKAVWQAHQEAIGVKKPNHKARARAVLELERRRQVTLEREWKSQRGKS